MNQQDELQQALQQKDEEEESASSDLKAEFEESVQHLGANTVNVLLTVIDGAIATVSAQITQKITQYLGSTIENMAIITQLRQTAQVIESTVQTVEAYRRTLDQYMKYLDAFPMIRKRVVTVLTFVDNILATARALSEDITRLTYANDYLNSVIGTMSNTITELISFRNLLKQSMRSGAE